MRPDEAPTLRRGPRPGHRRTDVTWEAASGEHLRSPVWHRTL